MALMHLPVTGQPHRGQQRLITEEQRVFPLSGTPKVVLCKKKKRKKPKSNPPLLSVTAVNLNYLKHQMLKSTTNQGAADMCLYRDSSLEVHLQKTASTAAAVATAGDVLTKTQINVNWLGKRLSSLWAAPWI